MEALSFVCEESVLLNSDSLEISREILEMSLNSPNEHLSTKNSGNSPVQKFQGTTPVRNRKKRSKESESLPIQKVVKYVGDTPVKARRKSKPGSSVEDKKKILRLWESRCMNEKKEKYNFDFENDTPLLGDYEWHPLVDTNPFTFQDILQI